MHEEEAVVTLSRGRPPRRGVAPCVADVDGDGARPEVRVETVSNPARRLRQCPALRKGCDGVQLGLRPPAERRSDRQRARLLLRKRRAPRRARAIPRRPIDETPRRDPSPRPLDETPQRDLATRPLGETPRRDPSTRPLAETLRRDPSPRPFGENPRRDPSTTQDDPRLPSDRRRHSGGPPTNHRRPPKDHPTTAW